MSLFRSVRIGFLGLSFIDILHGRVDEVALKVGWLNLIERMIEGVG